MCCIFSEHLFLGTPLKSCFCKVLSSTYLQMFKLSAIKKISLMKVLKRRGRRIEPYLKVVVISRQLLNSFSASHLEISLLKNFEQNLVNYYQNNTHLVLPALESDRRYQTLLLNKQKEHPFYVFYSKLISIFQSHPIEQFSCYNFCGN